MTEPSMTFCQPQSHSDTPPSVGSQIRWCNLCGQPVWAAQSTLERDNTEIVCLDCAPGVIKAQGGKVMMPPEIREELRRVGLTDAEIDRLHRYAAAKIRKGEMP